jgi:L,D-peptidoglycan transpeptidase YkuD (ErfK/YbiS/YcfS/YnhG family)
MTIYLKNKHTLQVDDFYFECCIGKKGLASRKREGDYKTPSGIYTIGKLFFSKDRVKKPKTSQVVVEII